jgi:hypothetical protein
VDTSIGKKIIRAVELTQDQMNDYKEKPLYYYASGKKKYTEEMYDGVFLDIFTPKLYRIYRSQKSKSEMNSLVMESIKTLAFMLKREDGKF